MNNLKRFVILLLILLFSTQIGYMIGSIAAGKEFSNIFSPRYMFIAIVISFVIVLITIWVQNKSQASGNNPEKETSETHKAYVTMSGSLIFIALAFLISLATKISPIETFAVTKEAIFYGLIGLLPLLLILLAFEYLNFNWLKTFRQQQVEFFASLGFRFTPFRVVLMSLGAGIGEELMFRGTLQSWLAQIFAEQNWLAAPYPIMLAIIIPSILFGLLHSVNLIYIVIATVVSIYLGVLFVVSGNILAPIITHTIYDIIAIAYTQKLIDQWRENTHTQTKVIDNESE